MSITAVSLSFLALGNSSLLRYGEGTLHRVKSIGPWELQGSSNPPASEETIRCWVRGHSIRVTIGSRVTIIQTLTQWRFAIHGSGQYLVVERPQGSRKSSLGLRLAVRLLPIWPNAYAGQSSEAELQTVVDRLRATPQTHILSFGVAKEPPVGSLIYTLNASSKRVDWGFHSNRNHIPQTFVFGLSRPAKSEFLVSASFDHNFKTIREKGDPFSANFGRRMQIITEREIATDSFKGYLKNTQAVLSWLGPNLAWNAPINQCMPGDDEGRLASAGADDSKEQKS